MPRSNTLLELYCIVGNSQGSADESEHASSFAGDQAGHARFLPLPPIAHPIGQQGPISRIVDMA